MPDDVALYFGRTSFDGVAPRAEVGVSPDAFIHGVRISGLKLAIRAKNFLGNLLEPLIQLAPENFLNAAFGPRHACRGNAAERAHLIEAHNFDFGAALCELLTDQGVLASGFP